MHKYTVVALVLAVASLGVVFTPSANADVANRATKLTFSEPVEVPGLVLPAGSYRFQVLDDNEPDIPVIEITSADGTEFYANILAEPDYRDKVPSKTIILFEGQGKNSPEAIKAWFYPGDRYGYEFVYPKSRAKQLARSSGSSVLSMADRLAVHLTKPERSVKGPHVKALRKAHVKKITPTGEEKGLTRKGKR